jgi:hypothetical protein
VSQLYFLGPDGDLPRFPHHHELNRLAQMREGAHLDVFVRAAWEAKERLWILDQHFFPHGHEAVELVLKGTQAGDVRLVTERVRGSEKGIRWSSLRKARGEGLSAGRLDREGQQPAHHDVPWLDRLEKGKFPYAHDRFAIVDDQLWHFGYAVGGSGKRLCASSGPWDATSTRAIDFFEYLWIKLQES